MNQQELIIKITLDAWNAQISRTNKLLAELTDEQLSKQVAPGRNSGVYLIGHLAAVHDGMLPLLGAGEKLYPSLEAVFLTNPDKSDLSKPSTTDLRYYWNNVNNKLAEYFAGLNPDQWLQKHNAVSAEDFAKEPHRNKLNVLLSRTNHLSNHLGQLIFLKK